MLYNPCTLNLKLHQVRQVSKFAILTYVKGNTGTSSHIIKLLCYSVLKCDSISLFMSEYFTKPELPEELQQQLQLRQSRIKQNRVLQKI